MNELFESCPAFCYICGYSNVNFFDFWHRMLQIIRVVCYSHCIIRMPEYSNVSVAHRNALFSTREIKNIVV